jgi:hypothetical protein
VDGGVDAGGQQGAHQDFPRIVRSTRDRLLTLPAATQVRPGHGEGTSIGEEAPHQEEWIARGH